MAAGSGLSLPPAMLKKSKNIATISILLGVSITLRSESGDEVEKNNYGLCDVAQRTADHNIFAFAIDIDGQMTFPAVCSERHVVRVLKRKRAYLPYLSFQVVQQSRVQMTAG